MVAFMEARQGILYLFSMFSFFLDKKICSYFCFLKSKQHQKEFLYVQNLIQLLRSQNLSFLFGHNGCGMGRELGISRGGIFVLNMMIDLKTLIDHIYIYIHFSVNR